MQVTSTWIRRTLWGVAGLFYLGCSLDLQAAGLLVRQPASTLTMPAEIDVGPRVEYKLVELWDGFTFEKPVKIASPPGDTNRLFVVERTGRIIVLTNLAQPTRTVFLDLTPAVYSDWDHGKVEGLSSLAFPPGYQSSRFPQFYVTYTMRDWGHKGAENFNRLSRFQSTRAFPNEASASTEVPLITQIDHGEGHNFNDLAFGPEGYLYVAVGDEGDGGTGDDFNNAQRINKNFFSGILRLDVDGQIGSLQPNPHPASHANYLIPPDNPFVDVTRFNGQPVNPSEIRTEFYAVGLRNPWRLAFDPATGFLYAGDVGQHGREEINLIVKGGNYGWAFREGTLRGPKTNSPPEASFLEPIYEYSPGLGPNQGFSVAGGLVYHGPSLPELEGAYIFADYVSGHIWSFHCDGHEVQSFQRLATMKGIAGFGLDPRDNELLLINHEQGKLFKLERTQSTNGLALPETLAETGAFADLESLKPHSGIVPYQINHPFWSDGAVKQRWFSVPDTNQTIGFSREGNWSFPEGLVWIKHFELTNALPAPRRLETRFLVKSAAGVYGVTYRWGDSVTNAVLVGEDGLDEPILVHDQGLVRTQIWRYPSRSECIACHTPAAGHALGFNSPQLNRPAQFDAVLTNQLAAWSAAGYFSAPLSNLHTLPALAPRDDLSVSREYRVRSYLAVNCANCHQPDGPGVGSWDGRLTTPLPEAGIINGPLQMTLGNPENRVVKPGSIEQSVLWGRISKPGAFHMPPVATHVLDQEAIELVRAWILEDLPQHRSYPAWQSEQFGSTNLVTAAVDADPDDDGASNYLEYLLGRNPLDPGDSWSIGIALQGGAVEITFPQIANRSFEVQFAEQLGLSTHWQPLDLPENRPFHSASNRVGLVRDPLTHPFTSRYYRVLVREP